MGAKGDDPLSDGDAAAGTQAVSAPTWSIRTGRKVTVEVFSSKTQTPASLPSSLRAPKRNGRAISSMVIRQQNGHGCTQRRHRGIAFEDVARLVGPGQWIGGVGKLPQMRGPAGIPAIERSLRRRSNRWPYRSQAS